MRYISFPFLAIFCLCAQGISAAPNVVTSSIPNAQAVGPVRVSVLFWDIYDMYLYAPEGQYSPEKPFALRLKYLRPLKGARIAERSIMEMRKEGVNEIKLAAWFGQLKAIFPDVEEGHELMGVFIPGQPTRFYNADTLIGTVRDPEFGGPFSRIWLGESTSLPDVREALIGRTE